MNETIEYYQNVCRGCLSNTSKMNLLGDHIGEETLTLMDLATYVISSDILSNEFSSNICDNCKKILILSFKFKKQWIDNESLMVSLKNKTEEIIEIDDGQIYFDDFDQTFIKPEEVCEVAEEEIVIKNQEIILNDNKNKNLVTDSNVQILHKNNRTTDQKCTECNIVFKSLVDFQYHNRKEHSHPRVCPICGKIFARQAIHKHIASHNKSKDHLCTECGKTFTLRENLRKHLRIHRGEKRYECEHCGEKFIHWNSKRSHIRTTHTGEKRY